MESRYSVLALKRAPAAFGIAGLACLACLAGLAVAGVAWAGHHPPKPTPAKTPAKPKATAAVPAAASAPVPEAPLVDATPDPAKVVAAYLDDLPPPPAHESVRDTLNAHPGGLDECAAASSGRSGRVVVRFTISPTGVAEGGSIALDEVGDPVLADCLVKAILALSYPREGGAETQMAYPIVIADGAVVHVATHP